MAESSSAAAPLHYDVFINFNDQDVEKKFVSHLYYRLVPYTLRVFKDLSELKPGVNNGLQIKNAIRSASVHVAIFSSTYAESVWCLDELLLMLESQAPIIPVFYDVKPDELRRTWGKDGLYAQAFQTLEKKMTKDPQTGAEKLRYDSATVENWRNALSRVADMSGFELEACNGDEGELVDMVVEEVLKKVKRPALKVAKYPTGLDDKVNDFEDKVLLQRQHSGKPRILGIVGLVGIGKTTLAKEFFNRRRSDYSKTCFLADVRENARNRGLIFLQKRLLRSLNVSDDIDNIDIDNIDEGIGMLRKHLSSSRALIILDDVDDVDDLNQVNALLPQQSVHPDSLVVITSRDKGVLTRSKVENTSIYKLTGLDTQHSQELFCCYAFSQPHPQPGFESLVLEFLKSCNGWPLSLKVFGALLYGRGISDWEDELESLQQILPSYIEQSLKISYNSLMRHEQQIFLDIACFFGGENMDMAIRIWDGSGWLGRWGFDTLRNKCLVEVDSENNIQIHDHLRHIGRCIAEEPGLPRRLWRWTKNVTESLLEQSLNGQAIAVRGIRMDIDVDDALSCIPMMTGLQLLDTDDVLLERILTKALLPNLIWLRLGCRTQFSMPSLISMRHLRVLHVAAGTNFKTLWEKESQAPLQLRELEVRAALSNIPESIGKLKHLERIVLYLHRSNLTKLPDEFCLLPSLKTLVIQHCEQMKSLPECFGCLTNLLHIDLSGCSKLDTLPDSFGNLTNLRHINLSGCSKLDTLRDSFGKLIELRHLNVSGCSELEKLPSMETLVFLEEFYASKCVQLKSIRGLAQCTKLRHLNVSGCSELERLPSMETLVFLEGFNASKCVQLKSIRGLEQCTELRHLNVSGCSDLENLPSMKRLLSLEELRIDECVKLKSIRGLLHCTKLKHLDVSGCFELEVLEALVSLEELWANRCVKLESIRGLEHATKLRQLNVSDCSELEELPNMERLICLEELWADGCVKLKNITGLEQATKLRLLNVSGCSELNELPIMETLVSLKMLRAIGCVKLKSIRGLEHCTELSMVSVSRCCELEEMPSLETLVSLKELWANRCVKLKSIRGLEHATKLQQLHISECSELKELPSMETLLSLEMVGVTECVNLKSIQGLAHCTKLRKLSFSGCCELEELPSMETLIYLESLWVDECVKLRSITGLGQCTKLRHLDVTGCSELEEFPSMETLVFLEEFYASDCVKPKSIEGLAECTALRTLSVGGCCELLELPSMKTLVSLEELRVNNCGKLKSIRGLAQCLKLSHLDVRWCFELVELEGVEHCTLLEKLDLSTCPKLLLGVEVLDQLRLRLNRGLQEFCNK